MRTPWNIESTIAMHNIHLQSFLYKRYYNWTKLVLFKQIKIMKKNISNELICQYSTLLEKTEHMLILISLSRNYFEIRTIFFKRTFENRKFHQSVRRNPALPRYVTHIYSRRLPAFGRFYWETKFCHKSGLNQLRISKPS